MASKVRTTVSFDPRRYAEFDQLVGQIGIRRDAYLNRVLPGEVSLLKDLPANTAVGRKLLRLAVAVRTESQRKVNLRLDARLVDHLNGACREKGIPRDVFFDEFLSHANEALGKALVYLENPSGGEGWSDDRDRPYSSLILSESEISELNGRLRASVQRPTGD